VAALSWGDLCTELLQCDDVATLQGWLEQELRPDYAQPTLYRALRIHGRMNAVRRAQEITAINKRCAAKMRGANIADHHVLGGGLHEEF
jgi:hypothetical protein